MTTIRVISFLCLFAFVFAEGEVKTEKELLTGVYKECLDKDPISCVKYKVYSEVDKALDNKDTITVTKGVQIVQTAEASGAPRALNNYDSIEGALFGKFKSFIESRAIKINVSGKDVVSTAKNTARSITDTIEYIMDEGSDEEEEDDDDDDFEEEARGKKKKIKKLGKVLGPIFGILSMKALFVVKLLILGVGFLAGNAFIISKLALVLSLIIGLKKLLASKHSHHEIVAAPIHTVSHVSHDHLQHGGYSADLGAGFGAEGVGQGHGGWARNAEAQNLAYKGYKAAQEPQS